MKLTICHFGQMLSIQQKEQQQLDLEGLQDVDRQHQDCEHWQQTNVVQYQYNGFSIISSFANKNTKKLNCFSD